MRFFLDANIPSSSIDVFKAFNHEVIHSREIEMGSSPDIEIVDYATKNNRVLVTKDVGIGNILRYPIKSHKGVVVLRLPFYFTAKQINNILSSFLKNMNEGEVKNAVTILEVGRYRVRK